MINNKRIYERMPSAQPVRYYRKGSQEHTGSIARDISEGGIGFILNEFLPVATKVIFETQHPKNHGFIKAAGEIVWVSSQPYSERFFAGARFTGPPLNI